MTANNWEEAWAEYVAALDATPPTGEEFGHWCLVFAQRLEDAKNALRTLDPIFCATMSI